MTEPAFGIDRGIAGPTYSPVVGSERPAGDRGVRSTVPSEALSAQNEMAALIRLGAERIDAGAEGEATECFRMALEIGDRTLSPDNPDLILLLNDLARLYLKQARYADAEPLLLRLFDIKRSKGEEHPEVATVLASLAAVRQALGQHESAEQLWRRVLEIRERTLAPNHFAIATALESLGNSFAARGNIAEALPAFQRALTIRERTLGATHPSLRISRERIADLQLQSVEDPFDAAPGTGLSRSADKYRLLSGEQIRLSAPSLPPRTPVARETAPPSPRDLTAQVAAKQQRVVFHLPAPESVASDVIPPRDTSAIHTGSPDSVPYHDTLETIRGELEQSQERVPLAARLNAVVETISPFVTKRLVIAGSIVVAVSALSLAVAKSYPWGALEQNDSGVTIGPPPAAAQTIPALTSSALATPAREASAIPAAVATASTKTTSKPHVDEKPSPRKADDSRQDTRKLSLPTISTAVMSHLDSVASSAANVPGRTDPLSVMPSTSGLVTRRGNFDLSEQTNAPTRARLIGELPTPRVPDQVSDVEGEVRVRFSVDAQGLPVMSTFSVVTSPNPLLTAAVKKVVPSMRFEPARTGGAEPRAIGDVVETGFRFTRQNR